MKEPLHIALVGCGTVGSAVASLLTQQPDRLAQRAGRPLLLRRVVVRDPAKKRAVTLPTEIVTTDIRDVLGDSKIDVAVELVGGIDWARTAVLDLLKAGKHVVTANKWLIACHGTEVFDAARQHDRAVAFEACVGGGIPIVAAVSQGLAANQITAIQAILNGTSNFVLTEMTERGVSYAEALRDAQSCGYAEADPSLDVDGTDAVHKLAILARLAFGTAPTLANIDCRGIRNLHEMDIRFAKELGYAIKPLAEAWLDQTDDSRRRLAMHVSPVLLRHSTPLAQVSGAHNAILVTGDAVGDTLHYGRGAGAFPTASAVLADVIDIAVGRAQLTFKTLQLWAPGSATAVLTAAGAVRSRFYLRLLVADRPGVLAEIAHILARHHISISSVIQHEAIDGNEGNAVPLVIMTHSAITQDFRAAAEEIDRCGDVATPAVYYPVGD